MNKFNSFKVQFLITFSLISVLVTNNAAAIIQKHKLINMDDGFLELKPNGTLILRSTLNNSTSMWQDAIIFKSILNAIRLMPAPTKNTFNDLNQKIYGDGDEHKFPPFLERVIQRIQTYFSIYKYTDTSQPLRDDKKSTAATTVTTTSSTTAAYSTVGGIINQSLTLAQNGINNNLTGDIHNDLNRNNNTQLNMEKVQQPLETSTSATTITAAQVPDGDVENEFIEIKRSKPV